MTYRALYLVTSSHNPSVKDDGAPRIFVRLYQPAPLPTWPEWIEAIAAAALLLVAFAALVAGIYIGGTP